METIPITEAKARIAELAERVAREHDHFTITRNGRADVMLISVAEYESMQETLDILGDQEAVADLRQSREDFAAGDTYTAAQVRAELEQRRAEGARHGRPAVRAHEPARPGQEHEHRAEPVALGLRARLLHAARLRDRQVDVQPHAQAAREKGLTMQAVGFTVGPIQENAWLAHHNGKAIIVDDGLVEPTTVIVSLPVYLPLG